MNPYIKFLGYGRYRGSLFKVVIKGDGKMSIKSGEIVLSLDRAQIGSSLNNIIIYFKEGGFLEGFFYRGAAVASVTFSVVSSQSNLYPDLFDVRRRLLGYADSDTLSKIERYVDLNDLYDVISYIEDMYGYRPRLSYSVIPETGEFDSVDIVIKDCTWHEWVTLAREVKDWLRRHGKEETARRVSIVCLKGLAEPEP